MKPIDINTQFAFGIYDSLGHVIGLLMPLVFTVSGLIVAFYFIIGAFELITSQGEKGHIVSARSKIYHALIGLILLIALFTVMQYLIPALIGSKDGLIF